MAELITPPAIAIGIDGSKSAVCAALWAIDEAVSRDIPLRLLYAVGQLDAKDLHPDDAARKLAAAETAVRYAVTAIESTDRPVKIEVEITQETPLNTLVRASRSAVMVCVGAIGFNHFQRGRVGSTAAAVAAAAHCPVAVIRPPDRRPGPHAGWIAVLADESPNNGVVLETAVEEARLRDTPLRVITCWQSRFTYTYDDPVVPEINRRIRADLRRRLAQWKRRYPELDVEAVVVHGDIVDYLAKNGQSVQLVIVPARDRRDVRALVGPAGNAALHRSDCSVLIVGRHHL
ncbi:MAG: universal stress protein [Mycobacteriaceae bacterium]|nr:universal stress protein [Mycobacteriaceae bacterium]